MSKHFTFGLFLAGGALAVLAGCGYKSHEPPKADTTVVAKPVTVTVTPLELRAVQRRIAVVGTLHGLERVQISSKVAGRLEKVLVDVGDRVQPGALLVEVNQTDFKLAVDEAQRA